MKKLFCLFVVVVLFTGCSSSSEKTSTSSTEKSSETTQESSQKNKKNNEEFYSDEEEKFQVTLPDGWTMYSDPEELVNTANAAFTKNDNAYISVGLLNTQDFESFQAFEDLSNEAYEIPDDAQVKEIQFNEFTGKSYTFDETIDGMNYTYVIYILDSPDYFMEAQFWCLPSKFEKTFSTGDQLIQSIQQKNE